MNKQHFGVLVGGILLLVVAMGISRFAFTPILPFMRNDEGLTFQQGGLLASSNYIGYFVGALGGGFILKNKKNFLFLNVLVNVVSILLLGICETFSMWFILRFIAGATGGFIFVLTSSIVMDYLAQRLLTKWSGYIYSGIGLGIAISGLFVPFMEGFVAWEGTWIGLGIVSALFMCSTIVLWRHVTVPNSEPIQKSKDTNIWKGIMPWLIAAYGLEGLGYIITGTFLVDIIYNIEELRPYASFSWVIVGLAGAPSAPIWMSLMTRYTPFKMMMLAYSLQVIGISLPVLSQTAWSVLLSAFLYGVTFIGLVTLSTGYGRQLYPKQSGKVVSMLTTFYALGQILGPLFASRLEHVFNTFKAPLLFASCTVLSSLIILCVGQLLNLLKNHPQH